jgi:IstB-like ATP binding protein
VVIALAATSPWLHSKKANGAISWSFAMTAISPRSMILNSQLPLAHWHEQIGDPTLADRILDRLVHNAYRIELNGESMRKNPFGHCSSQKRRTTGNACNDHG